MKLHQTIKLQVKKSKRIGRGLGSGRGKTSGRGMKGQKARGKVRIGFVGGGLPLYRKLPLRKGKGNPKLSKDLKVINLELLSFFKAKSVIDEQALIEAKIISKDDLKNGVKILSFGEVKNALIIKLPISKSAKDKIEAVGGRVENG